MDMARRVSMRKWCLKCLNKGNRKSLRTTPVALQAIVKLTVVFAIPVIVAAQAVNVLFFEWSMLRLQQYPYISLAFMPRRSLAPILLESFHNPSQNQKPHASIFNRRRVQCH